ncbi:MAG TPA: HAD-IB family hydrolase [Acidimicrobiales bacterium]|jgi:phosphatidylglycerophosphatase C
MSDRPATEPRRVAAFDFDGTLTERDTLLPFLIEACGRAKVGAALTRVVPVAARARLGRSVGAVHHRDATKVRLLAELFAGRESAQVATAGERYATTLDRRLRPDVAERVAWHRAEGHELVLVSASLLAYLEPFAPSLGFDHVIAVGLADDGRGRLTGEMTGPNVRGPEKETRLRAWLGEGAAVELWAYGNSSGDRELLAMADHPTWIGRAARAAAR